MTEEPIKQKCSGCRCMRSDYSRSPTRCDRCTDPLRRSGDFQRLKANPEAYAKFLAGKREARKLEREEEQRRAAEREARYRPITTPRTRGYDLSNRDLGVLKRIETMKERQAREMEGRVAQLVALCRAAYERAPGTTVVARQIRAEIVGSNVFIRQVVEAAVRGGQLKYAGQRRGVVYVPPIQPRDRLTADDLAMFS